MCGAFSRSMSTCARMVSPRSVSTMRPGPEVHGPPMNSMMCDGACGKVISSSDDATDIAQPVERSGRCCAATGHCVRGGERRYGVLLELGDERVDEDAGVADGHDEAGGGGGGAHLG